MDKLEYQVIITGIWEIGQKQLSWMEYVCKYVDCNIKINAEGIDERMLQLQEEKKSLIKFLNKEIYNSSFIIF